MRFGGAILVLAVLCVAFAGSAEVVEPVVVRLDLEETQVRVFYRHRDEAATLKQARKAVEDEGHTLIAACNGGIFEPSYRPLGLLVLGGEEIGPLNTRSGDGNFFLQPNGVFFVQDNKAQVLATSEYERGKHAPEWAVQSGPMLVVDGEMALELSPKSKSKYTRNAVAVDDEGIVLLVVAPEPMNLHDFAAYVRDEVRAKDALYLDGAISGVVVREGKGARLGALDSCGGGFRGLNTGIAFSTVIAFCR